MTPLLLIKKISCLTIIKPASKNTETSISPQQCTRAGFFFRQTNPTTKLNYCYRTWHRSLLSFACPSLQCVRCVDTFLWYFASFLSKEMISAKSSSSSTCSCKWKKSNCLKHFWESPWITQCTYHPFWGPLPYFTQLHFFPCAQLAREMQFNFSVFNLLDWHILKPLHWGKQKAYSEKLWW